MVPAKRVSDSFVVSYALTLTHGVLPLPSLSKTRYHSLPIIKEQNKM